MSRALVLASFCFVVGCSAAGLSIVGGGDASTSPSDGGFAFDQGGSPHDLARPSRDAGSDGGSSRDGGASSDGGASGDGGASSDGGASNVPVINCSDDHLPPSAPNGAVVTPKLTPDLVGLCDGWVVYSNATANELAFRNPLTGQTGQPIALDGTPGRLAFDADQGLLYVSLSPATKIAKVDLVTREVHYIDGANVTMLAIGNDGQVLGVTPSTSNSVTLVVFDAAQETISALIPLLSSESGSFLVFDREQNLVVATAATQAPDLQTLERFLFDPQALTVTLQQSSGLVGENGTDLILSRDGNHLVFPSGGGNFGATAPYTLFDFHTDDFDLTYGAWSISPYPSAAAFSPDGKYLASTRMGTSTTGQTGSQRLGLWDAATHVEVNEVDGCPYLGVTYPHVAFSRGGRVAFLLTPECVQIAGVDSGMLAYMLVP